MRFREIEVSGIESIVFNRKDRWILVDGEEWRHYSSVNKPGDAPVLLIDKKELRISHTEMMKRVNAIKNDKRYRMWVHFDTLNIVRRDSLPPITPMRIVLPRFGETVPAYTQR